MQAEPTAPGDASYANHPRHSTRRRLLRRLFGMAALGGGGTLAWAARVEPFRPVVERVEIGLPNLPPAFDGLRVALLSDLHIQPGFGTVRLKPALAHLDHEKPDLVLLLGDYVDGRLPQKADYIARCAQAFANTHAPLGLWAVFGNHDYPLPPADPDNGHWREAGVGTLHTDTTEIWRGGERLFLVGLRSFLSRPVVPGEILRRLPSKTCRLVLWHEPDRAEETATAGASLQVSGHTHGGQVRLPLIGPPFLPSGGHRYISGLYPVRGMPLYVTRGVGLLAPRVRLNCPPEVTLLTLRTKS